jgi:hypothetical protein
MSEWTNDQPARIGAADLGLVETGDLEDQIDAACEARYGRRYRPSSPAP